MTSTENLSQQILYHKQKYYNGEPEISDAEYDKLEDQLRIQDPTNPVLFIVGDPEQRKVKHEYPMLSCEKTPTAASTNKWANAADLAVDYKVDGMSLSLKYQHGKLIQAATRGNGSAGDDTTIAVMKIDAIPKTIPVTGTIYVRGELYMKISEFNRINHENGNAHKSPRNLAVGTIKQKDLEYLDRRTLDFMAFDLIGHDDLLNYADKIALLSHWGFESATFDIIENVTTDKIMNIWQTILDERDNLDFEIDGIIFKYNDATLRNNAGSTSHHPKWMVALKFPSQGGTTLLKGITWQIGRMGTLTPVAELETLHLNGVSIRRATLHNRKFLEDNNIAIGDTVRIIRSGDVIPKIEHVTKKGGNKLELPNTCPSCKSPVKKDGVNLICTGTNCKGMHLKQIRRWVERLDIKVLGEKNIEKLYDAGLVQNFTDLYLSNVTKARLIEILGKNGNKIYDNIQASRNLPFHLFLAGQGIETLGRSMGKFLAKKYKTWDNLRQATVADLMLLEGISEITAVKIYNGIQNPHLGEKLLNLGVKIMTPNPTKPAGKRGSIYVTGKIPGMNKDEVQSFVISKGYTWSNLKKSLSLLVIGDRAGPAKITKARKYGIPVQTWEEFRAQL